MLRKLQLAEVDMLKQLDRVCRAYDIPYFVIWGTALGTKRHKGFIPWDDDIDIGMLRSDYQRLKQVPAEAWNGLELIDADSDCFYHETVFPRLYKPGTILETEYWKKYYRNPTGIRKPLWMDIFLYDHVDSAREAKWKALRAHFLHIWYLRSKYRMKIAKGDSFPRKCMFAARIVLHYIFVLPGPKRAMKRFYKLVRKDQGKYLISYDNGSARVMMESFIEKDCIFPLQEMQFEDMTVMAPGNIEKMLEQFYGDYMTLPPENERIGHVPHTIEL